MTHRTTTPDPCHCTGCGGRRSATAAPDWPATTGPSAVLFARRGGRRRPLPGERPAAWVDHAYRVREPGADHWTYIAEPYSLSGAQLADLAALEAAGWHVVITAEAGRHLPGRTLSVRITERAG